MPLNTTEKQFESDIAAALLSPAGGYTRNGDCYDPKLGLFVDTLIRFVQKTQPNEWAFFEKQNPVNPVRKFCTAFNNACDADGLLSVLRYGFKHRGRRFRVCYFQPESRAEPEGRPALRPKRDHLQPAVVLLRHHPQLGGHGAGGKRHPGVRL